MAAAAQHRASERPSAVARPRRVLVVATEPSADIHAAALVLALQQRLPGLEIIGMGGERLRAAGQTQRHHARELSVMGLWEVLPKIPAALRMLWNLARLAEEARPDVAVLVDSPDFNLRLAPALKRLGIPVVWYIAPTVWAWRESRVELLERCVDRMLCILPFEEAFFRERGVDARYVGSPVVEDVGQVHERHKARELLGISPQARVLALLPGSRRAEVSRLLPVFLETAEAEGVEAHVPLAPGLDEGWVRALCAGRAAMLHRARACDVLAAADAGLVASGTATLEAALVGTPFVVAYRLAPVTHYIARHLVTLECFSLPNLILGRKAVPELLQREVTPHALQAALHTVAQGAGRQRFAADMKALRGQLAPGASAAAAVEVTAVLTGPGVFPAQ